MKVILATILMSVLASCASTTESKYLQAERIFVSTVRSLVVLRDNGKLNDDQIVKLTEVINGTNSALIEWRKSLENGEPRPDLQTIVFKALEIMIKINSDASGNKEEIIK